MDSYSYIRFSLLALFSFLVFSGYSHAAQFSAAYNSFTLSNTVIDVGQISVANTVVSGGSGGPYSGQFTWINQKNPANQLTMVTTNTITIPGSTDVWGAAINPQGTLEYVTDAQKNTVFERVKELYAAENCAACE